MDLLLPEILTAVIMSATQLNDHVVNSRYLTPHGSHASIYMHASELDVSTPVTSLCYVMLQVWNILSELSRKVSKQSYWFVYIREMLGLYCRTVLWEEIKLKIAFFISTPIHWSVIYTVLQHEIVSFRIVTNMVAQYFCNPNFVNRYYHLHELTVFISWMYCLYFLKISLSNHSSLLFLILIFPNGAILLMIAINLSKKIGVG